MDQTNDNDSQSSEILENNVRAFYEKVDLLYKGRAKLLKKPWTRACCFLALKEANSCCSFFI